MTKPLHPRPSVSAYWLAYLLLSFDIQMQFTDTVRFNLSGHLLAPLLAAWLGWKFGRRGLVPLWIALPFIAPQFSLPWTDYLSLNWGLGVPLVALCAGVTLCFAREGRRDGEIAAPPPPGVVHWVLYAVLFLVAASRAEISAGDFMHFSFGFNAVTATPVLVFLLVFSGRIRLWPALCLLLGVCTAGYLLGGFVDAHWSPFYYVAGVPVHVSVSWGGDALQSVSLGTAAGSAGWLLRRELTGEVREIQTPRFRTGLVAGFASLFVLPVLLSALPNITYNRLQPEVATGATGAYAAAPALSLAAQLSVFATPPKEAPRPVTLAQFEPDDAAFAGDEVVVVAARRADGPPGGFYLGSVSFNLALAALALAAGLRGPQSLMHILPAGAALLGALWFLADDWLSYGGEGYIYDAYAAESLMLNNVSRLMVMAATVWVFAWIGGQLKRRRDDAEGGPPWPGT